MIRFQRRKLRSWLNKPPYDYTDYNDTPPILEFETREDMIKYIYEVLPHMNDGKLEVYEDAVIHVAVIGFIRGEDYHE